MSITIDQLKRYLDATNNFLSAGKKTANYKFVLFLSIIRLIEQNKGIVNQSDCFLDYDSVTKLFFKMQYILHMKYRLKILQSRNSDAKILELINNVSERYNKKFSIEEEEIDEDTVNEIQRKVLNRTVLFLLRKDIEFYDFYDDSFQKIEVPFNVSTEQEFRSHLSNRKIKYLGFATSVCEFIKMTYYSLLNAVVAEHTRFLETLNLTPRLLAKVKDSVLESFGPRQISSSDRETLLDYDRSCFYCGKVLTLDLLEVDHFLPYTYLFDSPIWDLVSTCSDCNRKKHDKIPQPAFLKKLLARNLDPKFQSRFPNEFDAPISEINLKLDMMYTQCTYIFDEINM